MKPLNFSGKTHGIGGGPRWRIAELADHLGVSTNSLIATMRHDPTAPKPLNHVNQRSQPGGSATCPLYSLRDFKAWWKSRQEKVDSGTT